MDKGNNRENLHSMIDSVVDADILEYLDMFIPLFLQGFGGCGMKYKTAIIKMVLEMRNEPYLERTYHYILAKYRREKGGTA